MNKPTAESFDTIISQFDIKGEISSIKAYGSGHINDTFLLKNKIEGCPDYLLQRVNDYVFKDVDGLMNNARIVTNHLRQKLAHEVAAGRQCVLTFVDCHNGKNYYRTTDSTFWRVSEYIKDTNTYDVVATTNQAYQGGLAFGKFQYLLSDLDPDLLVQTIPDFLNIEKRLRDFSKAIEEDVAGRVQEVREEIDFLMERTTDMGEILHLGRAGILPLRITHNDTKFNNVLLDSEDNFQCVIDLDTVMPGYAAYDFGDAIRTIINKAAEDEADLSRVQLNIPLFAAYTKGYLTETKAFLTEPEVKSLIKGVLLLPYMQTVRFLTDYIQGDVYYKIHHPKHNLQRTHSQLQLVKMLEKDKEELTDIIYSQWLQLNKDLQPVKN